MLRRTILTLAATAATAALLAAPGDAQAAYPERPITIIVPWGAGGGTDATARIIATLLEGRLGVPVNVVNRTGGSGVVGHSAIATADPDGYTLGIMTVEINMMHWQGLTELTWEDYTVLALYNADPAGLQVPVDSPWQTAADVIEAARAAPGSLTASGTGQGGIWHLALAGMLVEAGLPGDAVRWVPSEGAAPGLQEMVAGNVHMVTCSVVEARSLMDAGRVKSLASMSAERLPAFPDVPTLAEAAGIDWQLAAWRTVVGPAGMPQEVVDALLPALRDLHGSAEFLEFMAGRGFGVTWLEGEEFRSYLASNNEDFGRVMRAVGIVQ
jgi:tripartite-type tricarboxylate transporter receptor subunit TctC